MESGAGVATTPKHIRPSKVIDEAFSLYAQYARVLIPVALLVVGVVAILQGIAQTEGSFLFTIIASVLNLLASALFSGFVVKLVEDVRDGRRDFSVGDLLASVAGVLGTLVINSILLSIGVTIGLVLLIIPGLYLITIWALCAPAIVIEHKGITEAFGRSHELTRHHKMPVFLTLLLGLLIMFGLAIIFGAIGAAIGNVGLIILQVVGTVIAAPVFSLIVAVLYFELREGPAPVAEADPDSSFGGPPPGATA